MKYGFATTNSISTPAYSNVHLHRPLPDDDIAPPKFPYQSIVGSLLHVNIFTSLDISQATTTIFQFSSNFWKIHYIAVKRILKYLRGTTNYAFCYTGDQDHSSFLVTYSDADYAGDLNDRKSRSGCVILLNGARVLLLSRKQHCVATSTTKSKYLAASLTSKQTVWLRRLICDIGLLHRGPTLLQSDNQCAIWLVHNLEFHKRTKHIDVVYHKIREMQTIGEIDVSYVSTDLQFANIFTKPLILDKFSKLRSALNII